MPQVAEFPYSGEVWASVEQAYQGSKFPPGSRDRARLLATRPRQGETGAAHGMRQDLTLSIIFPVA